MKRMSIHRMSHLMLGVKRKVVMGVIVLGVGAFGTASASAALIAEHIGDNNPFTETVKPGGSVWTSSGSSALGSAYAGPPAAWNINDNTISNYLFWQYTPSSVENTDAWSNGFKFSLSVRVNTIDQAPGGAFYEQYGNGSKGYLIYLGSDATGQAQVQVNTGTVHTIVDGADGTPKFHLYELIYDPTSSKASLFVDGISVESNIVASTASGIKNNRLIWGSGSTPLTGSGDYALVRLETPPYVPEPTTLSLLALGGLLLMRHRRAV